MIRVHIASAMTSERSALRLVLLDLNMEIAGETGDWLTTLAEMPICRPDILVVDWELLPLTPSAALDELRMTCPTVLIIILISHLETRQQTALLVGGDMFISKSEMPERVAEHLRAAAAKIRV